MPRPTSINPLRLEALLRSRAPVGIGELAGVLRVNRSTVLRSLEPFGTRLMRVGSARNTRYALRREVGHGGNEWPIWRVNEVGDASEWARVAAFHDRLWRVEWSGTPPDWADRFSTADGFCHGFPHFLTDCRPQGFLGRAISRALAPVLHTPVDPRLWSDDDTVLYMASEGADVPGNLVFEPVWRRVSASQPLPARDETPRYPDLAAGAVDSLPGTSAGGEQPKFAVRTSAPASGERNLLVKFSPPLDQPAGRRWADLLLAEAHAHATLARHGLAHPGANVVEVGGRRFLEIPRFDRMPDGGRKGVVSLDALHSAAIGVPPPRWTGAVGALVREGLTDAPAARATARLEAFGILIGNTDMHAGNLSFWLDDSLPFRLAPAYDMLPMLWAPGVHGEITSRPLEPIRPDGIADEIWDEVSGWAGAFWRDLLEDPRISADFARLVMASPGIRH